MRIITKSSMVFKAALSLPPAKNPTNAPINAKPAKPTPMQYSTNMTLLAVSTATIASSIAEGHLSSERLVPGFNSLCNMAVGSKVKKAV